MYFEGKSLTPMEFFHSIKLIYKDVKQLGVQKVPRYSNPPVIENPHAWGFFNGANLRNTGPCRVGDILYLHGGESCPLKLPLGRGTNNWGKCMHFSTF
jgi:hypothetical protein